MDTCDCPTCGRSFDTKHGMKIHHARAHDESIAGEIVQCAWCEKEVRVPTAAAQAHDWHVCSDECDSKYRSNRYQREDNPNAGNWYTLTCEQCGEVFDVPEYDKEDSRFCSRECLGSWTSENRSGRNSHAWEGGNVTLKCEACGGEYDVYPARATESRFCSHECKGKAYKEEMTGAKNPSWGGGKVVLECEYCGEEYKEYPANQGKSRFCSTKCLDRWRAENLTGQNSPTWRGGGRIREAVKKQLPGPSWRLIRDLYLAGCCSVCGSKEKLHLHHIVPLVDGGTNGPWNLLTLCRTCHTRTEHYTREFSDPVLIS